MRTPDGALAWLEQQRASGSTAWYNMCESLQRQAYGLPAHYSSAEAHGKAVPASFKHGHETPSKGDLVIYLNGGYGHIVTCTGNGWECYTNDYGGRGKVTKTDARNLVSWCHATSWFVADAWWSSSNYIRTHNASGGGADVPLTDAEIQKIADAVWSKAFKSSWDGNMKSMATFLTQANYYAINGGILGNIPATATSGAGSPTVAQRILTASENDYQGTPPPGGGTPGSGPSAAEIADATADEIAARMKE
jgi:hypothetical protein